MNRGKYYTGEDRLPISDVLGDEANGYASANSAYNKANRKQISPASFGQSGSLSSDDDGKVVVCKAGDQFVVETMQDLSVSGM